MTTLFLFWYDPGNSTLEQRITGAVASYRRKFEQEPNLVYVPLPEYDESIQVDGLRIVGRRDVLKKHIQVARQSTTPR